MGFICNSASGFSNGVSHALCILSKTAVVEGIKRPGRVSNPPLLVNEKNGCRFQQIYSVIPVSPTCDNNAVRCLRSAWSCGADSISSEIAATVSYQRPASP